MKKFLLFICLLLAVSNKTIAKETTYNKEVYRSIGETTKELIYDALKSSI